jgi:sec-independent protein translocase protein TatC
VTKQLESKDEAAPGYDDPPMTIWEHLTELRKRLVMCLIVMAIGAGIAWEIREQLLAFLVTPFADAWRAEGLPGEVTLHFQTPAAAFLAYFKLSLYGGAMLASPVVFYQLWAFVAPGLYAKEKRFVIPFVVSSTALFTGGGYFGWSQAFPLAFKYLLGLSGTLELVGVQVTPTVMMGDYISFVLRMLLAFGVIFEIPLFIFFLSVAGVVNYLHLIRYGRWFVVAAFVAAALITPPDITSQVMMAIPMVVLYLASILLAYVFGKPPTEGQKQAYRFRRERIKNERRERREAKRRERKGEPVDNSEA